MGDDKMAKWHRTPAWWRSASGSLAPRAGHIFALKQIEARRSRRWPTESNLRIDGVANPLIASRTEITIPGDMGQESAVTAPELDEAMDLAARRSAAEVVGRVGVSDFGRRGARSFSPRRPRPQIRDSLAHTVFEPRPCLGERTVAPRAQDIALAPYQTTSQSGGATYFVQVIATAPAPSWPVVSRRVKAGPLIFVSGTVGPWPRAPAASPFFIMQEQTRRALTNYQAILQAGGAGLGRRGGSRDPAPQPCPAFAGLIEECGRTGFRPTPPRSTE